jgi:hypothetical protein
MFMPDSPEPVPLKSLAGIFQKQLLIQIRRFFPPPELIAASCGNLASHLLKFSHLF